MWWDEKAEVVCDILSSEYQIDILRDEFEVSEFRWTYISKYGFVLLTNEVVSKLTAVCQNKKVVDIGSGLGYLSYRLKQARIDIRSVDYEPTRSNYFKSEVWDLDFEEDALNHDLSSYDIIFLSWPPYDHDFGDNILKKVQPGQIIIYQGEGPGGCTGDDSFHKRLATEFDLDDELSDQINSVHVQFPGIHDQWRVYTKK